MRHAHGERHGAEHSNHANSREYQINQLTQVVHDLQLQLEEATQMLRGLQGDPEEGGEEKEGDGGR
jgi:hypothetical protein